MQEKQSRKSENPSGGSEERTMTTTYDHVEALERMAKDAAWPLEPGMSIKAQQNRSAQNLGYRTPAGMRRVLAAWYRETHGWSAAKFFEFKQRYDQFVERQRRLAEAENNLLAARLQQTMRAADATDPDFFGPHIHATGDLLLGAVRSDTTAEEDH